MKKAILKNVLILFLIFQSYHFSYALNPNTHEDINEYIARNTMNGFSLELYLRNSLGFEKGITTSFNSLEVWQWLRAGGEYEDIPAWYLPYVRSLNHFHNPFTEEGLKNNCSLNLCLSSTIWMLMPVGLQSPTTLTGNYSWYDVKNYYYLALTSADRDVRSHNFAQTFRGLGQVMHLIEDASVPAHARDDAHLFNNYETWVGNNVDINNLPSYGATFFNGIINNTASFIDTNQYNGSNPSASAAIGLSEYAQANFFSEDTIFSLNFPFPKESSTDLPAYKAGNKLPEVVIAEDNIPDTTFYIKKDKDGEVIERFVKPGYFTNALLDLDAPTDVLFLSFILDEKVYSDYASLLLPRAVGYSAGLLNYFFRGTLEITAPDTYVYSIIDGSINPQQFTKIKAKVRNTTPNEQIQAGVLQAVAKYKKRTDYQPDLSTDPPTQTSRDADYSYSVSAPIPISSLDSINPQEFTFNFENSPIPAGITDLYLFVIFKGTLGNEADTAIAAGMKDIKEPTHHTFWNLTDRISLGIYNDTTSTYIYHLYTSDQIKNTPALARLVDLNRNGIFNESGEPYIEPYYIDFKISYMSSLSQEPVGPLAEVQLPPGRHIRLIVLVDSKYNNYVRMAHSDFIDTTGSYYNTTFEGVINQEWENGTWQTPTPIITFRQIRAHFYTGVLRCEPITYDPVTRITYCPYPEEPAPADTTPQTATINFQ